MPTRKNRKQTFTRAEKGDVKGKVGEAISNDGRNVRSVEFPTQGRDTKVRVIELRK